MYAQFSVGMIQKRLGMTSEECRLRCRNGAELDISFMCISFPSLPKHLQLGQKLHHPVFLTSLLMHCLGGIFDDR